MGLQQTSFEALTGVNNGYTFYQNSGDAIVHESAGVIAFKVGGVIRARMGASGLIYAASSGAAMAQAVHIYSGGVVPVATTSGTDVTPSATVEALGEVAIPGTVVITGISYLIGSVGGTDLAIVVLRDASGAVLATSTLAGTTVGTTATFQRIAFTAPYTAFGPQKLYVGLRINGTTARYRAQVFGNHDAGEVTGLTFATVAALTPPSTFTASKAPIAMLY